MALGLTVEAQHHSYKEVLKQLTVVVPTQYRGGGGYMEVAGTPVAHWKGGVVVRHDGVLAGGGVCHTLWEMKLQLMDLQEKVDSFIRKVENGRGMGLDADRGLGGINYEANPMAQNLNPMTQCYEGPLGFDGRRGNKRVA